jgi:hypothetical protein
MAEPRRSDRPEIVESHIALPRRPQAIGLLTAADFRRAQALIRNFSPYESYDDWLDCREGRIVGLSAAGVDAKAVNVNVDVFCAWCSNRRIPADEANLDRFASLYLARSSIPSPILPIVSKIDFRIWQHRLGFLRIWDTYNDYCAYLLRELAERGDETTIVNVSLAAFFDWTLCLRLPPGERAFAAYAHLLCELSAEEIA